MDEPAIGHNDEVQLPRSTRRERQIARLCVGNRRQPQIADQRGNACAIPAPQRIPARHNALEPARLERPNRQPDAIQPRRRIAPMQPEPRADRPARRRHDPRGYAPG